MLASDVAQVVRLQLVAQLDSAAAAIPAAGDGIATLASGTRRGFVDATLSTSRLERALREAAIAETMLTSVSGRYGQARLTSGALESIESATNLVRRGPDADSRSIGSLLTRLRHSLDDPAQLHATRDMLDDRLASISRHVGEARDRVAVRTAQADDAGRSTWISEDGEIHEFF